MKHGFIKTAAAVPQIRTADPLYNAEQIIALMKKAMEQDAGIIAFPELCITGYTCGDLFLQDRLLDEAREALDRIRKATKRSDALVLVGFPLEWEGKLYNTAAVLQNGELLCFIPKRFVPNYAEFYELRQFTPGPADAELISYEGREIPFGSRIILDVDAIRDLEIAAEICEDAWVMNAPDIEHAMAGANLIINLSASNETVGKDDYRRSLFSSVSARTISAYVYVSAGDGESTQDIVFGGRILMYENGSLIAQRKAFDNAYGEEKLLITEFDISRLNYERRRTTTYFSEQEAAKKRRSSLQKLTDSASDPGATITSDGYLHLEVHMARRETTLTRRYDPHPFVPSDKTRRDQRCEEILNIQARGLAKRLAHIGCRYAVIGVSGGLDSTLAMLVTARAFDLIGIPRENLIAVTMPCFGTTDRTKNNALTLSKALGADLREVPIAAAVMQHFADIGQDPDVHDVTYENSQARERTQILMDIANKINGIVVGTGDLSELALGWATYNGDHMSMYGVNAGIPKTLVSHLVRFFAETAEDEQLSACLFDVLDTPVSPELLPPTGDGQISQKTEDLVGPYELHDFFLYYILRCGFTPSKVYRIALLSFAESYDPATIHKWLMTFCRRFFTQQFKRSCLPDGPKVGSVAVSPRGDLRMPSDASYAAWIRDLTDEA